MKPVAGHTPTVQVTFVGRLPFPFDMLRYDACFPVTQDSVTSMEKSQAGTCFSGEHYEVTLEFHHRKPTHGRWNSFGWHEKKA